jgi:hypothetical protein
VSRSFSLTTKLFLILAGKEWKVSFTSSCLLFVVDAFLETIQKGDACKTQNQKPKTKNQKAYDDGSLRDHRAWKACRSCTKNTILLPRER